MKRQHRSFTREAVINMAEGIEFNGLKYDPTGESAIEAGQMLRAYAKQVAKPSPRTQET